MGKRRRRSLSVIDTKKGGEEKDEEKCKSVCPSTQTGALIRTSPVSCYFDELGPTHFITLLARYGQFLTSQRVCNSHNSSWLTTKQPVTCPSFVGTAQTATVTVLLAQLYKFYTSQPKGITTGNDYQDVPKECSAKYSSCVRSGLQSCNGHATLQN